MWHFYFCPARFDLNPCSHPRRSLGRGGRNTTWYRPFGLGFDFETLHTARSRRREPFHLITASQRKTSRSYTAILTGWLQFQYCNLTVAISSPTGSIYIMLLPSKWSPPATPSLVFARSTSAAVAAGQKNMLALKGEELSLSVIDNRILRPTWQDPRTQLRA